MSKFAQSKVQPECLELALVPPPQPIPQFVDCAVLLVQRAAHLPTQISTHETEMKEAINADLPGTHTHPRRTEERRQRRAFRGVVGDNALRVGFDGCKLAPARRRDLQCLRFELVVDDAAGVL
jgi:hypothetical protein